MKIIIALLLSITSASAADLRIPPLHKQPTVSEFHNRFFFTIGATPLPKEPPVCTPQLKAMKLCL